MLDNSERNAKIIPKIIDYFDCIICIIAIAKEKYFDTKCNIRKTVKMLKNGHFFILINKVQHIFLVKQCVAECKTLCYIKVGKVGIGV